MGLNENQRLWLELAADPPRDQVFWVATDETEEPAAFVAINPITEHLVDVSQKDWRALETLGLRHGIKITDEGRAALTLH